MRIFAQVMYLTSHVAHSVFESLTFLTVNITHLGQRPIGTLPSANQQPMKVQPLNNFFIGKISSKTWFQSQQRMRNQFLTQQPIGFLYLIFLLQRIPNSIQESQATNT
ncbi:hypothetical protein NPIL_677241 [Nephila pilipes]|uniref:Uncharacterized protein n=1 Tax=Nephila pilipes TaxID=299642 RepID=A0A8X6TVT2_NEPPI|nr:hypothetical protein NPIL_677241 [Nephila pilipes]